MTRTKVKLLVYLSLLQLTVLSVQAYGQVIAPPAFGQQTDRNRYESQRTLVYEQDFEGNVSGVYFEGPNVYVTQDAQYVIDGASSVLFSPPSTFIVMEQYETNIRPNSVYEIEFDYSIIVPPSSEDAYTLGAYLYWSGVNAGDAHVNAGPIYSPESTSGQFRRRIRTGTEAEIDLILFNLEATIAIDNLRIYRDDPILLPAKPPIQIAPFPRIGNYNLYSSFATSLRNDGMSAHDVESILGMFDLVTGYEIDHTLFPTDAGHALREINPSIQVLPYHQSFVAQLDGVEPVGGVAGMLQLFNRGIQEEWLMRGPEGEFLEEPWFPNHFQMNHTEFSPLVDGTRFTDYAIEYLANSVLATGLWDGIHFDQSEWFPNPLLADTDPFLEEIGPLPPIDADGNGVAETEAELQTNFYNAFIDFFSEVHDRLGYTKLLFGNAGEIPSRASVLQKLNGYQREFTTIYPMDEFGDFDLRVSTGWYDLLQRYTTAETYLREPQVLNFQFTGFGLGEDTGTISANGLPDRFPALEVRDFQRMRLGLTTVLMGDGFFGYDFIDNTTLPVWFDEYAVNASGVPEMEIESKGYLGQPLGEKIEIENPNNVTLLELDFESAISLPDGVHLDNFILTSDPSAVIEGSQSIVISNYALGEDESTAVLFSLVEDFPLESNTNYQLFIDYLVLDNDNTIRELPLLGAGIVEPDLIEGYSGSSNTGIWDAEPGQRGTLRVSTKTTGPGASFQSYLLHNGSVALDNIRVVQGTGGIYRRDFERGIALVNPTNQSITLTQQQVAGPFNRSGIRRISGIQDPVVNDGSSVNSGITIPATDGIILLADEIVAAINFPPAVVNVGVQGTEAHLAWPSSIGTVAGYLVEYGIGTSDFTSFVMTGEQSPQAVLQNLEPGTDYRARVASYDFEGQLSAFRESGTFTTPGLTITRPLITSNPLLAPGSFVTIFGSNLSASGGFISEAPFPSVLAGTQVLVNDVPAPIAAVQPHEITFVVPNELGGNEAILQVNVDGVDSPSIVVPVSEATPLIWTWDGVYAIAFHNEDYSPVTAENPARLGDAIIVLVSGTGKFEPLAPSGITPLPDSESYYEPQITIGGVSVGYANVIPAPWYGIGLAAFSIPETAGSGPQDLVLSIAGITANTAAIVLE